MEKVLAVILGGGAGTRLYPLTRDRAKPAVPLGGKYRLIDIPISNCLNSDIDRILVLTQYLSASLNRHISRTYSDLGHFSRGWVQILAAEQGPGLTDGQAWYQGTADAVRKQMFEIESAGAEEVLILSGDHLYRMDYQPFLALHRRSGADITIAAQPVTETQAHDLGILATNEEGRIIQWAEKPKPLSLLRTLRSRDDPDKPYLASMGIYVFSLQMLRRILDECPGSDFGHHIVPHAITRYKVGAFTFEGFWADIGTIRAFYEVNLMLTHPERPFSFYEEGYPIYTHPRFLPPSRIDDCQLTNVLVSEGCRLCNAVVKESVIGVRSRVDCDVKVSRTLMMGADYYDSSDLRAPNGRRYSIPLGIGPGCTIEGAILDKNVRIGANVTIRPHDPGDDGIYPLGCPPREALYVIRDGVVVIPKHTEIPDGMVI
ncbi:MAG: glucose-1-phosphate adenylyltransferase [Anaerolineae bacterium]|nr:glucose-1-phosphate adenylyltransferase [Anaerolineae bacterium]